MDGIKCGGKHSPSEKQVRQATSSLESSPNFCRKKHVTAKRKEVHSQITQLLWLILATSLPWKAGNESGCYQPLQHLVTPARWHRTQLFPALPGTGSQQCCERECVWAPCARLVLNRRRKEIGRRTTEMGEEKYKERKGSIPISHTEGLLRLCWNWWQLW